MLETERFVADCRTAFAKDPTHKAVREVLARAVSDPAAVLKGLGEPHIALADLLTQIVQHVVRRFCLPGGSTIWSLSH